MPDRRRSALHAWVPAVVALLVQLVTTGWALHAPQASVPRYPYGPTTLPMRLAADSAGSLPAPGWVNVAALALAVLGPAALVVMRRAPRAALAVVTAGAIGGTALCAAHGLGAPFYASVLFGVAMAAYRRARAWAWACAGAYWFAFALTALLSGDLLQLGWLVPLTLLSVGALLGPELGRSRREARAQALRDAEARRAEEAQAERVRIARELHDVLAHSLSQINVQASVALHLFGSQPANAEHALANIKDTSRQALGEVRQVLGMLRGDNVPLTPEHGVADLDELVESIRAQGIAATLRREATDAWRLPTAVQQAAYRIVQEALTNVTRHARATHVDVDVDVVDVDTDGARLRVTVRDDGIGARDGGAGPALLADTAFGQERRGPVPSSPGTGDLRGRGLLGMRERAELLGGSLSAGGHEGGGFEVVAELPLAKAP